MIGRVQSHICFEDKAIGWKINKRMIWNLWILCFMFQGVTSVAETRRPIWNIAHMVNTVKEVDIYLDQGANGLEFDVQFDQGNPVSTFHNFPCDCLRICRRRELIDTYIDYLREITTPGSPKYREQLVFLFMDLKVQFLAPEYMKSAGENIAKKLLDIYWQNGKSEAQAFVLLSVPSVKHIELFQSFQRTIQERNGTFCKDKIGFEFSGNEDLNTIQYVLDTGNISSTQFWQGDGFTNCFPRGTKRLLDAIKRRDYKKNSYMSKVYWWTVDRRNTMKRILSFGADGMITNNPQRLIEILNETEFARFARLANINDNPWRKYPADEGTISRLNNCTALDTEEEILYNI